MVKMNGRRRIIVRLAIPALGIAALGLLAWTSPAPRTMTITFEGTPSTTQCNAMRGQVPAKFMDDPAFQCAGATPQMG
jgi:hypothetical protein